MQGGGQGFEPPHLHLRISDLSRGKWKLAFSRSSKLSIERYFRRDFQPGEMLGCFLFEMRINWLSVGVPDKCEG